MGYASKLIKSDLLLAPKEQSRLAEAEFSQPCLVAIQVALVDLLRSWGVTPDAVVGHSSGETAAAYASGAITAEDAIRIAYHRGQITLLIKAVHKGSMAAVGLGRSQVQKLLRPGVMIGCENSPASVTLSGEADVLEDVMKDIMAEHPGVLVRSLHVECGYHSRELNALYFFPATLTDIPGRTYEISRDGIHTTIGGVVAANSTEYSILFVGHRHTEQRCVSLILGAKRGLSSFIQHSS